MLVAPLPYGDVIIGVLKVVAPWVDAYHPEDVRTLELLNTLIGATLSHAAHHSSVEAAFNSKLEEARLVADEREELRKRIQDVIAREAFEIAFQPVLALESGAIVGFEALARFTDARSRPPDRWFDDALQAGLNFDLEIAVARKALESLAHLPRNSYLAINVSPETAASSELARLCARHAADRIVLEITEHSSVDDYLLLAARARALREMGVHLAIDDAGAGFASLRHVLRLEPDLIKLDKSITRNIDTRVRHQSLAAALLTFASGTSASIVAEGIETAEESATLKRLGVPYGQGYYLGRPDALQAYLRH
jgi:EAL domain-containing protein (putative c-di-GMP-specific phosphodiesterase class I)